MSLVEIEGVLAHHQLTQVDYYIAKLIREETEVPEFKRAETRILRRFFTNVDKNTFLILGLPEEVVAVLLAMYSRMKNERGVRGVFLKLIEDVPLVGEFFANTEDAVRRYGERTLIELVAEGLLEQIQGFGVELEHYRVAVDAKKIKGFLGKWLDSYGHNSIARTATLHICVERVSTIAAKALEWARMGTGFIELSTRYVSMGQANTYPVWRLLDQSFSGRVQEHIGKLQDAYRKWDDGRLEQYWSESWPEAGIRSAEVPNAAVVGKTGDSIGNILQCGTYTSLGISVSGEALTSLIRHLYLDGTPECIVLADEIIEQISAQGSSVFLRHYIPNSYALEVLSPNCLHPLPGSPEPHIRPTHLPSQRDAEKAIRGLAGLTRSGFTDLCNVIKARVGDCDPQKSHDKLPRCFEGVTTTWRGTMTWRSWRDLQRHQLCTHLRGSIGASYGIYIPPDMPADYTVDCQQIIRETKELLRAIASLNPNEQILQYLLPMGALIPFTMATNLRQAEFLTWQRSGWSVHEEVRRIVLSMDSALLERYPWWRDTSRTDRTPSYIFARGDANIHKIPRAS